MCTLDLERLRGWRFVGDGSTELELWRILFDIAECPIHMPLSSSGGPMFMV